MATKGIGRPLTILLQADTTGLGAGLQRAQTNLQKFSKKMDQVGKRAGIAFAGIAGGAILAAKGLEEAQRASARLDNVLTSMGYADATERVDAYAESLQNSLAIDADVIKATQTKLATFANLTKTVNTAGGAFDRATVAALDLAAAGFGTAEGNAVQLGKALEDPIKGIAALAKSGVTFTAQEKEKIKTLVQSNQILEAQDMVLSAIEKQVGGTAAASASSFDKIKLSLDGVSDAIATGILPLIEKVTPKIQAFSTFAQQNANVLSKVVLVVGGLAGALYGLSLIIKAVTVAQIAFNFVAAATKIVYLTLAAATGSATAAQTLAELTYKRSTVALVAYKVAMIAQAAATNIATIAQYALNLALTLNPIGIVIAAVAALIAIIVLAYKNSETFRNIVDTLFKGLKVLGGYIKDYVIGYFTFLFKIITKVKDAIVGIGRAIADSPVGQAISSAFQSFDGFRAAGGPVRQGKSYIVGEAGPELFTANTSGAISSSGSFGGGGGVNITINGAIDPEGVRRSLETLFQNSARRTSPVNFAGARL